MEGHEAGGKAGLSLDSHAVSGISGSSAECSLCPLCEAREEVIGFSSGGPQQSVLLMEPQVYAGILSTHLKFRTHKCNLWREMKPSAPGSVTAVINRFPPSMPA